MQSTRNLSKQQSLLKKIENILQKNLDKIQKFHQTKILQLRTNIKDVFIKYYTTKIWSYFKQIFKNLNY